MSVRPPKEIVLPKEIKKQWLKAVINYLLMRLTINMELDSIIIQIIFLIISSLYFLVDTNSASSSSKLNTKLYTRNKYLRRTL